MNNTKRKQTLDDLLIPDYSQSTNNSDIILSNTDNHTQDISNTTNTTTNNTTTTTQSISLITNYQTIETEILKKLKEKISFQSYLYRGYKKYLLWLTMIIGSNYTHHIYFCVARNLNITKPYIMGIDLEVNYLIKRLEKIFGSNQMKYYEDVIKTTLQTNLNISDLYVQNIIEQYHNNSKKFELVLDEEEFMTRLSKIPIHDLDQHSFQCWRNENHEKLNQTSYPITIEDIINGESLAPPSSKHIGIQMLEMCGYVPIVFNPKTPEHYSVTFIE